MNRRSLFKRLAAIVVAPSIASPPAAPRPLLVMKPRQPGLSTLNYQHMIEMADRLANHTGIQSALHARLTLQRPSHR
jgi:hypothetical protein